MVSYDYIQFINEKVLDHLPSNRVRVGDKINLKCPLCGDSRKSATKKRGWYYMSNASYYCFNCSTGMSGIRFLEYISGSDYDEIKREYLKTFAKGGFDALCNHSLEIPKDEPSIFDLHSVIKPNWKNPLTADATSYLANRKIFDAPYFKEDLFSCITKTGEYILIPWVINGIDAYYQLNDFKKLGSIKYIFPKNSKKLVYGLDNIDITWPYIICFEGVYDSLFVKNAIACGTKSITDYQMKLIRERYPNHQICVSFDNDVPGITAMTKIIEHGSDIKFFKWFNSSTKSKDINDYILETGNIRAFTNKKQLEQMILTPLQMKMWLMETNNWNVLAKSMPYSKYKQVNSKPLASSLNLKSRRFLFE